MDRVPEGGDLRSRITCRCPPPKYISRGSLECCGVCRQPLEKLTTGDRMQSPTPVRTEPEQRRRDFLPLEKRLHPFVFPLQPACLGSGIGDARIRNRNRRQG